ncbi:MAG: metallophosphoesterase family protein [Promethearchaeota archaeon]
MKFIHLADTHLGYVQYNYQERENDYYNTFNRAIDKIIELKPEFVVHSGDLFHAWNPNPRAMLTFKDALLKLKDNDIDFYCIAGNHDSRRYAKAFPPQVLYKYDENFKLFSFRKSSHVRDGVFISGLPYISSYYIDNWRSRVNELAKEAQEYQYKIIILHQAINIYLPFNYEIEFSDLPTGFDYYAMGHIHKRITATLKHGSSDKQLAYAGSLEFWRKDELDSYYKDGKGFFEVELKGESSVNLIPINIPLSRNVLRKDIKQNSFRDDLNSTLESVLDAIKEDGDPGVSSRKEQAGKKLPILFINLYCSKDSSQSLYNDIMAELKDKCLIIKIDYIFQEDQVISITDLKENLDFNSMLKEECEHNEALYSFALEIYRDFEKNDVTSIKEKIERKWEEF